MRFGRHRISFVRLHSSQRLHLFPERSFHRFTLGPSPRHVEPRQHLFTVTTPLRVHISILFWSQISPAEVLSISATLESRPNS